MNSKNKNLLTIGLLFYSLFVSTLIAYAAVHDDKVLVAHMGFGFATPGFLKYFVIFLAVYYARSGGLLLPLFVKDGKWQKVTAVGIKASVIPELVILATSISLARQAIGGCTDSGFSSTCGWGLLSLAGLSILAIVVQLIGMGFGAVAVHSSSKRFKSSSSD